MNFDFLPNWAQSLFHTNQQSQANEASNALTSGETFYTGNPVHKDLGNGYVLVDPDSIDMSDAMGMDDPNFWNHHANNQQDYYELVQNWGKVNDAMENGESLEAIRSSDYPDEGMRKAANSFFNDNTITVTPNEQGGYRFDGDGRHRVQAAKDLGIDIPVRDASIQLQEESGSSIEQDVEIESIDQDLDMSMNAGEMNQQAGQSEDLEYLDLGEDSSNETQSTNRDLNAEEPEAEEAISHKFKPLKTETEDEGEDEGQGPSRTLKQGAVEPEEEEDQEEHVAPAEFNAQAPSQEDMSIAPEEEIDYDYGMTM
ncbi:MAG: hypothetical protein IKG97_03975 [Lachnospiraceae bacterium]|nr:hypothetical protein [Lachnospiraceae bacterium]